MCKVTAPLCTGAFRIVFNFTMHKNFTHLHVLVSACAGEADMVECAEAVPVRTIIVWTANSCQSLPAPSRQAGEHAHMQAVEQGRQQLQGRR